MTFSKIVKFKNAHEKLCSYLAQFETVNGGYRMVHDDYVAIQKIIGGNK